MSSGGCTPPPPRRSRSPPLAPGRCHERPRRPRHRGGNRVRVTGRRRPGGLPGAGVFGTARSHRYVFDGTVARWWDEGGWKSFAVVTAIGVVAVALGAYLALAQVHRNDGRQRTPTVRFPPSDGARGETTLRSAALSHNLETDLEAIADVHDARVGLFGRYPTIEMRAVLAVGDSVDLEQLPARVDAALARMQATTGRGLARSRSRSGSKAPAGNASSTSRPGKPARSAR